MFLVIQMVVIDKTISIVKVPELNQQMSIIPLTRTLHKIDVQSDVGTTINF